MLRPFSQRIAKTRVVVVVETADAYEKLDAPLLNRFEKQVCRVRGCAMVSHVSLVNPRLVCFRVEKL